MATAAHLLPRRHRARRADTLPAPTRDLVRRLGHEATLALVVAGVVLGASVLSLGPTGAANGDTGGPTGDGAGPRLAVGGAVSGAVSDPAAVGNVEESYIDVVDIAVTERTELTDGAPQAFVEPAANVSALSRLGDVDMTDPEAQAAIAAAERAADNVVEGPFLADGTLLKPVAVDTVVADGSSLIRSYKVKSGETLAGIAKKMKVSMMTLWWANDLKTKKLHKGQKLTIPPVSGLVVKVKATDTLEAIATKYKVTEDKILEANEISDPNLVVGQVLVLPGAKGKPMPKPKPKPVVKRSSGASGGSGGSARAPRSYSGGNFRWPTSSHNVSQRYRGGHYGLDIDGSTGDPIYAAAGGTVQFAGWKSNGGGYQVWIAHGSGLYTTYNHMSSVSVGRGQHVGRGQRIGRMGASGYASGSHLHFEVWRGPIWNGGKRVNPLAYL
ncbi:MAG TPA: M23 family metallopeptidase [Candidatus Saccharimonadales bacterium]|nr:M23 family metallopeptidase [Candidatus Saccharimonadales bacterium]